MRTVFIQYHTSSGAEGGTGEIPQKVISYLLTTLLKPTQTGKNIRTEGLSNEISLGKGTILSV